MSTNSLTLFNLIPFHRMCLAVVIWFQRTEGDRSEVVRFGRLEYERQHSFYPFSAHHCHHHALETSANICEKFSFLSRCTRETTWNKPYRHRQTCSRNANCLSVSFLSLPIINCQIFEWEELQMISAPGFQPSWLMPGGKEMSCPH